VFSNMLHLLVSESEIEVCIKLVVLITLLWCTVNEKLKYINVSCLWELNQELLSCLCKNIIGTTIVIIFVFG
jgi:hypothetical protein